MQSDANLLLATGLDPIDQAATINIKKFPRQIMGVVGHKTSMLVSPVFDMKFSPCG